MSKHNNFSLIGSILPAQSDSTNILKTLNVNLEKGLQISKRFKFFLGSQNQNDTTVPEGKFQLMTFNISKYAKLQPADILNVPTYKLFRKKDYNTLYQVNTIPKIIIFQNGKYKNDFIIDWSIFQDVLILSDSSDTTFLKCFKLFFQGFVYDNSVEEKY